MVCCLAFLLPVGLKTAFASVAGYDAFEDNFETEVLDAEKWETLPENAAFDGVKTPLLTYTLGHNGYVSTKEPITVNDGECLIIEFKLDSINVKRDDEAGNPNCGYWGVTYGQSSEALSATNMFAFYSDSMMLYKSATGGDETGYNIENSQTQWIGWDRAGVVTVYVHSDGSQELYEEGMLRCYRTAEQAADSTKNRTGYAGIAFSGTGAAGNSVTASMEYFKIGKLEDGVFPADEDGTVANWRYSVSYNDKITWLVADENPEKAGVSDKFVTNQPSIEGWKLANNRVKFTGAAVLTSKATIKAADEKVKKTFALQADLGLEGIGTGEAGFKFGTAFAGICHKDGKYYVTVKDGETIVDEKETTSADGRIEIVGYGTKELSVTYNGVTAKGQTTSDFAGAFSFVTGEGVTAVYLDNVSLKAATEYISNKAKSVATSFDGAVDENSFLLVSDAVEGAKGAYVENGKLMLDGSKGGFRLATKEKFNNFVLEFDMKNLMTTDDNCWFGIGFGMATENDNYWSNKLVYLGRGVIQTLNCKFGDGSERIWDKTTIWDYPSELNIHVKLECEDGTATLTIDYEELGTSVAVIENVTTEGHIALFTENGVCCSIDNLSIVNTDEVKEYELVKKTLPEIVHSVYTGKTVNGKIDLGDIAGKKVTFSAPEQSGFTMNADGSYSFAAGLTAGTVTLDYSVTIDDWFIGGYLSPAGEKSVYTLGAAITVNVSEPTVDSITAEIEKTDYEIGEDFDASGLTVKAAMSDGSEKVLAPTEYTIDLSAYDKTKAGTYEITVSCGEITTKITVTVKEKQPEPGSESSDSGKESDDGSESSAGENPTETAGCFGSVSAGGALLFAGIIAIAALKKKKED